ncbi:serine/threonine protein kinase, partial [bacterium]
MAIPPRHPGSFPAPDTRSGTDPGRGGFERDGARDVGRVVASTYRLVRPLGRGGVGVVYEAHHVGTGARVAVKLLDAEVAADASTRARFAREAKAAAASESPHVVRVIEAGDDGERLFLVMELLDGEDLGARLRRLGRLGEREVRLLAAQTLRGLAAAHDAGVVHRDLKPDNVFLTVGVGAKIVDFGMSKLAAPMTGTMPIALTRVGSILGTPFYMAPEQIRGEPDLDGRADVYAVGVMLYECLTGRPPYVGETYEQILLAHCTADAPSLRW